MSGAGFDPLTANAAESADEALALARAWAEGTRSWTNLVMRSGHHGYAEGHSQQQTVAVMDAQEVVKWSALAVALSSVKR